MPTHGPLRVDTFVEPMFQENGYLLSHVATRAAWIIDPGFAPQPAALLAAVRRERLAPSAIVLTHCHPDHFAGIGDIRSALGELPIFAPRGEARMLIDPVANLSAALGWPVTGPPADHLLDAGQTLTLADVEFRVLDVGGHSPAGMALYAATGGLVFTGDSLMSGAMGRVDFPGGSGARLMKNIRENLLTLPDDTAVYSGHGPATTIGREKRTNPFLQPGAAATLGLAP